MRITYLLITAAFACGLYAAESTSADVKNNDKQSVAKETAVAPDNVAVTKGVDRKEIVVVSDKTTRVEVKELNKDDKKIEPVIDNSSKK